MPAAPFETQPNRIPETCNIPRSYTEASALLGTHPHVRLADETYLVRCVREPAVEAIELSWYGLVIAVFDGTFGWLQLTTCGYPHYRAVFDIFQHILAGSRFSLTTTGEDWPHFFGGAWSLAVHLINADGTQNPTPIPNSSIPFSDLILLHPATGHHRLASALATT